MIEIIVLIKLGMKIAERVRAKGHSAAGYVILLILLWFTGEFIGVAVGVIIGATVVGTQEAQALLGIGCGLVGASCGAVLAFMIANRASDVRQEDQYYDRRGSLPGDEPYWNRADVRDEPDHDPNIQKY
jgi:hypothetical protein